MILQNDTENGTYISLSPNRSASWHDSKLLIGMMLIVIATIAVGWLVAGVWMILPFAGFEVGLFALLMYVVSRQTYRQQNLEITDQHIKIVNKLGKRFNQLQLNRSHCYMDVIETERDWQLPMVYLVNEHHRVLIGEFLNLEDRHKLRDLLHHAGLPLSRTHWWKSPR